LNNVIFKIEYVDTHSINPMNTSSSNKITDITFAQIKDNYWWAQYGPFKVIMDHSNGYINATHLCSLALTEKGTPKQFYTWKQNASATVLTDAIASSLEISRDDLFKVITGGQIVEIRGTYAHPDLIPHIACWASVSFAIKVSKIVNAHLVRKYKIELKRRKDIIVGKDTKIDELQRTVNEQSRKIDELLGYAREQKTIAIETQVELDNVTADLEEVKIVAEDTSVKLDTAQVALDTVQTKLNIAVVRRVPPEQRKKQDEVFILYSNMAGRYKAIRCQKCSRRAAVNTCIEQGYTHLVYSKVDPSAVSIFNRIKLQIQPRLGVIVDRYYIQLAPAATEAQLLTFVAAVDAQRGLV
jgi:hypothetical protein